MPSRTPRLVLVSGPSCVGKSPLKQALDHEFPELGRTFRVPVLFHSRSPRPGERDGVDYHFRSREEITELGRNGRYLVFDVRGELQAIDLAGFAELLGTGDVFYEGNVHIALALKARASATFPECRVSDLFVSPLSARELVELLDASDEPERHVAELMRRKLLRRAHKTHASLSLDQLEDIERRANAAFHALAHAAEFGHVIANHDGEDSDHWDLLPQPIGDARRTLYALVALLEEDACDAFEAWPEDLLLPPACDQNGLPHATLVAGH